MKRLIMPKCGRLRACCSLVLSVVLVSLLGACSRISLESNPLGRTVAKVESKDNQERVNGWPIYYKCGDASSFAWPLYQQNKDGHIVFPLYEYDRSPRCIKPAMGLVGSFQLDRHNIIS